MTTPTVTFTLPCGLRVVCERNASPVVHCGYVVCAGTRHEDADDSGMAHFIEHLSFKGTEHRRAYHISNGLERVGGDLNAFTNKQETVYYAAVLQRDFRRAADLLTDIVFHSTYPQHEIDREVEVICDEIESYKDSPSELIFDEFESMLYADQPLGRDILGRAERLRTYTTADARRFTSRHYRPTNAVFYVRGNISAERVQTCLKKLWGEAPSNLPHLGEAYGASTPSPVGGRVGEGAERAGEAAGTVRCVSRDTHQAHVLIGAKTFGGRDERRFPLMLLNNILGGPGMNSRLNMSLRERAGLVYSVDASLTTYPDTGWWAVYFGCDVVDVARCRRLVERELRHFIEDSLTPAQLRAAQKQLCGQIGIAAENGENRAIALGKTFAHYGTLYSPVELCRHLQAVTAEQLQAVAAEVYDPSRLTTLIYK